MGGVVIVERDLGHDRVERDGARVIGHDEGATLGRNVVDAAGLDPEPALVQRSHRREDHPVIELCVEAEVIDDVLPRDAAPHEVEPVCELRVEPRG